MDGVGLCSFPKGVETGKGKWKKNFTVRYKGMVLSLHPAKVVVCTSKIYLKLQKENISCSYRILVYYFTKNVSSERKFFL